MGGIKNCYYSGPASASPSMWQLLLTSQHRYGIIMNNFYYDTSDYIEKPLMMGN